MGDPRHSKQMVSDGIHTPIAYEYADAAARTGATGFDAADVGKIARQEDDNSLWLLTATTPTWAQITRPAGHVIQDNGSPQTQRTNLNFIGMGIGDDAGNDATIVELGLPRVTDTIALTNQTADIPTTELSGTDGVPGLYRINYYIHTAIQDGSAGIVTLDFIWTDASTIERDTAALSGGQVLATADDTGLAVEEDLGAGTFIVRLETGAISYTTVIDGIYGTSAYNLYIVVERLQ